MREYSNNEQSCEEQREEEQFKALLEKQMRRAAADLNFEAAAELRDKMTELKKQLQDIDAD